MFYINIQNWIIILTEDKEVNVSWKRDGKQNGRRAEEAGGKQNIFRGQIFDYYGILSWSNIYGVDFLPDALISRLFTLTNIRWGAAAQKLECGTEESERASERNQEPDSRLWERHTRCHEMCFLFINSSSLKQIRKQQLLTTDDVPILISIYRLWLILSPPASCSCLISSTSSHGLHHKTD